MNTQTGYIRTITCSFYRRDWLLRLLDKWHFTAGWAYISTAATGLIVMIALPGLMNRQFVTTSDLLTAGLQSLVIMPLGAMLYVLVPAILARLYNDLRSSLVIPDSIEGQKEDSYVDFIKQNAAAADSGWWKLIAITFVALYAYYRLAVFFESDSTLPFPPPGQRLALRLALLGLYSPLMYAAMTTLGRLLVCLFSTPRLFRLFETQVNPLSPEGAGGLGKLGSMLIGSLLIATMLGGAAAVMIIVGIANKQDIWRRPETIALGGIYLVFTPSILYCWLWAPHQALMRGRARAVQPLANEYRQLLSQALPQDADSLSAYKNRTELLTAIKAQHDLISDSFPVWPISTRSLKNLVTTSSLPVVSPVVTAAVAWLSERVLALLHLKP